MFDVGDLPVLTFGNCVLKPVDILSGLWNYTYVFYVLTFFSKSKKNMTFYFFWIVTHVFSNTAGECLRGESPSDVGPAIPWRRLFLAGLNLVVVVVLRDSRVIGCCPAW